MKTIDKKMANSMELNGITLFPESVARFLSGLEIILDYQVFYLISFFEKIFAYILYAKAGVGSILPKSLPIICFVDGVN